MMRYKLAELFVEPARHYIVRVGSSGFLHALQGESQIQMCLRKSGIKLQRRLITSNRFPQPVGAAVANTEIVLQVRILHSQGNRLLQMRCSRNIVLPIEERHAEFALSRVKIRLDSNRLLICQQRCGW